MSRKTVHCTLLTCMAKTSKTPGLDTLKQQVKTRKTNPEDKFRWAENLMCALRNAKEQVLMLMIIYSMSLAQTVSQLL